MQRICIHKTYISRSIYDFINICIHFVQFIHCLYVRKIYKDRFSQLVIQIFYSLYYIIVCTKNMQRPFQLASCIGFAQSVHYLYVQKNMHLKFQVVFGLKLYKFCTVCTFFVYMQEFDVHFCTFIIKENFDLYNLCIQNIYKLSVLYNFCIIQLFGKGCYGKQLIYARVRLTKIGLIRI